MSTYSYSDSDRDSDLLYFSSIPSTPDHNTFSSSGTLSLQPHGLPTYSTFLSSLVTVDINTLSPGAECSICRVPYSDTPNGPVNDSETQTSDLPNTLLTSSDDGEALNESLEIDNPVRLPCPGDHVVGEACMREWAREGGNTCPLDREPLFHSSHGLDHQHHYFSRGRRAIDNLPLRTLLNRAANFTSTDMIHVNAYSMAERLSPLILRTAIRQAGIEIFEWLPLRWPRLERHLAWREEASVFSRLLRRFVNNVPLDESTGKYPAFALLLLDPLLPHIYAILHRMIREQRGHRMSAIQLRAILSWRIDNYFRDYADSITVGEELRRLVNATIELWVASELFMTELRQDTGEGDDSDVDENDYIYENHRTGYTPNDVDAWGRSLHEYPSTHTSVSSLRSLRVRFDHADFYGHASPIDVNWEDQVTEVHTQSDGEHDSERESGGVLDDSDID